MKGSPFVGVYLTWAKPTNGLAASPLYDAFAVCSAAAGRVCQVLKTQACMTGHKHADIMAWDKTINKIGEHEMAKRVKG